MPKSQQKRWLTDLLEGLPSIVFILIWRQSGDLELSGWFGAFVAFGVLGILGVLKTRMHTIVLGVNIHILLVTPVIVGLFRIGLSNIAEILAMYAHAGVLLTVFVVGIIQTVATNRGFSNLADVSKRAQRRYSTIMLGLCGAGVIWAMSVPESSFVPVVVTLTVLIVGRNFLQARLSDKNGTTAGLVVSGMADTQGGASETAV